MINKLHVHESLLVLLDVAPGVFEWAEDEPRVRVEVVVHGGQAWVLKEITNTSGIEVTVSEA